MPQRTVRNDGKITQVFFATEPWTVPPGVQVIEIECHAAGGPGGNAVVNAGGGGGGGAYARKDAHPVTPGQSVFMNVPAGGTLSGANANAWVNTVSNAPPASLAQGCLAAGGQAGANGSAGGPGAGGAGGVVANSIGDTRFSGGSGGSGAGVTLGGGGGGGAGGTGAGNNGGPPPTGTNQGGQGGTGTAIRQSGGQGGAGATTTGSAANGTPLGGAGGGATTAGARGLAGEGVVKITYTETGVESSNAQHVGLATIRAIGDELVSAIHAGLATTFAEGSNLSNALHTALETIFARGDQTSQTVHAGPWRIIATGLEGTVYDAAGTAVVPNAQVLIFRDDTNQLVATLTSDTQGEWAVELDDDFTYWVSAWEGDAEHTFGRSDRGLPTVETQIQSGSSGP
jgi:hypothetical protein